MKKLDEMWRLLNETSLALNRTAVREKFQEQMDALHACLHRDPLNPALLRQARRALTELRRQLGLAGYDLYMGKYDLLFDGFHDDDVWGNRKRAVLFISPDGEFQWETGEENHLDLEAYLEQRLKKLRNGIVAERHYLWFLWTKTSLILSGSASERQDSYQKLKDRGSKDPLLFLSRIQGLY
ncbi:MAG: hypothetical protein LBG90_04375 [Spirochaetaceae bacterium]|jgi:hypothetical protein|nr:hypothetical protein [Spirochaetaceae bacterium]